MDKADWTKTANDLFTVTRTIRCLINKDELKEFINSCEHSLSHGSIFSPSHWMVGNKKLELILNLARSLYIFLNSIPSIEESIEIDKQTEYLKKLYL